MLQWWECVAVWFGPFIFFPLHLFILPFPGCGKHIEQALKDVPKEERCACVKENCKICGCVLEAKSAKDMEEVLLHHNKDQH